jgi:hypothetical protein
VRAEVVYLVFARRGSWGGGDRLVRAEIVYLEIVERWLRAEIIR